MNKQEETAPKTYFWTESEHMRFVAIFQKLGRKWKAISNYMEGRSTLQCRTHGQKYLLALKQFEEQVQNVIAG